MINKLLEDLAKNEPVTVFDSLIESRNSPGYNCLSHALCLADKGDEQNAELYLGRAKDYCDNNRMIFPDIVAAEIKTLAKINNWRYHEKLRKRRLRNNGEEKSYSPMIRGTNRLY